VILYSVRGKDGVLFELLDDNQKVGGTLSMDDFVNALKDTEARNIEISRADS